MQTQVRQNTCRFAGIGSRISRSILKTYTVRVGDGTRINARGRGNIDVEVNYADATAAIYTMTNILYVPKLRKNLLSIIKTTERGIKVTFMEGGNQVLFEKNEQLIVDGIRNDNLYRLNMKSLHAAEVQLAMSDSLKTWHERLGHVNYQTLRQMRDRETVEDLQFNDTADENPFCEGCVYGKQHRQSFPKTARRSTIPGEIFHADLCGKMSTASLGGANYFLLLKDDFSRYCFIYFHKSKTDVLGNLKQFYAEVQADGHQIKKVRTDNGLEFCNIDVDQFLRERGIKHETLIPRAPEQNGFIERQNRTVVESAKSMIHSRNAPRYLWAEAANTAVYVKNRTASETLGGLTPFEKWFGDKPSVKHLRTFGSDCYVHVPKDQRTKWDMNSVKCLMIGYSDGNKGYRVYDPATKRIMIRRDVIFHEDKKPETVIEGVASRVSQSELPRCEQSSVPNEEETKAINETDQILKRYKNPRLPIPRSPYPKRKGSRSSENDEHEQATIAVTFMANSEPLTIQEALKAEDSNK